MTSYRRFLNCHTQNDIFELEHQGEEVGVDGCAHCSAIQEWHFVNKRACDNNVSLCTTLFSPAR